MKPEARTALTAFAVAVVTAAAHPAVAADLGPPPPTRPPADFAPPIRAYDVSPWTGFYLGGTIGSTWGSSTTGGDIGAWAFDQSGTVGTLFAGYNWQLGRAVLGVEADIGIGNVTGTAITDIGTVTMTQNTFGSFRARAGILVSPSLLVYATGGLAWSNMDFALDNLETVSRTLRGYQIGAGSELKISDKVNLRFEYIYTDFGTTTVTHSGLTNTYDPTSHTVRAGISFKF